MSLYTILMTAVDLYIGIIFIYILMSWLPMSVGVINDIYQALGKLCDPYLDLFRRIIPPVGGAGMSIDFSPIIAVVVLQLAAQLVGRFLLYL